ncbi:MAG TPA: efflux transporter outer membrane subunit [Lunatimonas sp.]|nr:efflux transporter outer membrane subunit [Lunatimonas sp.]
MNTPSLTKLVYIPVLMVAMSSCFTAKTYDRPQVVEEANFRTDNLSEDSLNIAELSWRELFLDEKLADLIELGLQNNLDVRVALQQILAAESYFKQGKAGNIPLLSINPQVTHQELSRNSQFGAFFDGGITQYEISANLSWEADIWGKIRSTRRAFEAGYLQSVAAHQAIKTELISRIATHYFQLMALDEQLKLTKETIANREIALETTQALKESGIVTEVAVKQTEAQLHTARVLMIDLELEIKLLENTVAILLGDEPRAIERASFYEQEINPELGIGFPLQLLRNRPDVIAAEFGLVNAFELTNVARSSFYPSLTISATSGLQSLQFDRLFSLNSVFASFIGGLTQPILNGRRIQTAYEVSLTQQEQAYLEFRRTILSATKEVSDALYTFEASERRIIAKNLEFQAYDISIEYSEELLDNGIGNFLEVLTARENALNSELGLINARLIQYGAIVELYRALGGGWQ